MQPNEYVKLASRTKVDLGTKQLNNYHMIMGLITEVGELTDTFKKELAYRKEIDWINIQEEMADILWYIAGLCDINGFDLEEIMDNNIKKLMTRYPERFTTEHALNRNLSAERKVLEELNK
jgi:NTP pyrophosphatase (non-canonical NTP hydrolase)